MPDNCILSIDQGTTSSRAILFSPQGDILAVAQQEFTQHYPQPGWVEHDPQQIWQTTLSSCQTVLRDAAQQGAKVKSIGITNQRETTLVWDKSSGEVIYNAIVWQDRRTAQLCKGLTEQGHLEKVKRKTGLLLDPYFSASKIAWILDNVEGARQKAEAGELAFGTIDSFLIWRLTEGQVHATDVTNASRTSLFNIHTLCWDDELLSLFNIPKSLLPRVLASADEYGLASASLLGQAIPIHVVACDQQAAAIGQCCFQPGNIKSTYGTGCFALLNTGEQALSSNNQLLTTIAYQINGQTHYALEGSIFIAGAGVQWLRDGINVIEDAKQTENLAQSLDYDHGVYLVPAFAGLGAPYWDPEARGAIFGLTRGTNPAHLARATLESVCYQTQDLLKAMAQDGAKLGSIKVDGGMVANDWLCQFLADILQLPVQRPRLMETTALGAAYLAGLQGGIYGSLQQLSELNQVQAEFSPSLADPIRSRLLNGWKKAVNATLAFSH